MAFVPILAVSFPQPGRAWTRRCPVFMAMERMSIRGHRGSSQQRPTDIRSTVLQPRSPVLKELTAVAYSFFTCSDYHKEGGPLSSYEAEARCLTLRTTLLFKAHRQKHTWGPAIGRRRCCQRHAPPALCPDRRETMRTLSRMYPLQSSLILARARFCKSPAKVSAEDFFHDLVSILRCPPRNT